MLCSQRAANNIVGLIQDRRGDSLEVCLDARLVLRGRRHDARLPDRTVGIKFVSVPANAARGLGAAETYASKRFDRHRCNIGRLIGRDQSQCLLTGIDDLEGPHDDAAERVVAYRARARLRGRGPEPTPAAGRN